MNCPVVELLIKSSYLLPHHAIYILLNSCPQNIKLNLGPDSSLLDNVEWSILGYQRIWASSTMHFGEIYRDKFAVTPCQDYLWMSWDGSEKNRLFQLNVSISTLWSSSGESTIRASNRNVELKLYNGSFQNQPQLIERTRLFHSRCMCGETMTQCYRKIVHRNSHHAKFQILLGESY